jgi:long-subunit fatty acid transport protein
MKTILKIIFSAVLLITNITIAQNYNDVFRLSESGIVFGARSLGMGNAYTAAGNDLSSMMFNPAGLALIKKAELYTGLNYNNYDNNVGFFNRNSQLSNSISKLGQFGVALPMPTIQGSFVLGFGYTQVKDFNGTLGFNAFNSGNNSYIQDLVYSPLMVDRDIAYKLALSYQVEVLNPVTQKKDYVRDETFINGKLNQRGNILQDGSLNAWSFSAAIEVEKDIFVGATINLYSGSFNKNKEYYEEDVNNIYPASLLLDPSEPASADFKSFTLHDRISWDISGSGLSIGGLMKVNNNLNLAANIKFSKTFTVKETYYFSGESYFGLDTRFVLDQTIARSEYEITTPAEFTFGSSYIINNLTVSASTTMIDYSSAKFKSGFDLNRLGDKNADIKSMFRTVINLNAGFEYVLPSTNFSFRGGFILMRSPFRDDPIEYDKKFLTVGVGIHLTKSISIDGAYAYGWWKDFGDNYGSGLSRTYQDIKNQNIITSLRYNF